MYNSEVEGQGSGSGSGTGIAEVNSKKFGGTCDQWPQLLLLCIYFKFGDMLTENSETEQKILERSILIHYSMLFIFDPIGP